MEENVVDLPVNNSDYKDVNYWNSRYQNEVEKDWLLSYEKLENELLKHVEKNDRILMLGCGNSLLSENMYKSGFLNIVNIDYSPVVIRNMSNHCEICHKMQWITMDAQNLQFSNEEFDVVIEKATIDSLLVTSKDHWNVSGETKVLVGKVLQEISRVLKDEGRFISISFSQPHFRGPIYADRKYNWSYSKKELGLDFHYYFYTMVKGQKLINDNCFYQPPTITQLKHDNHSESDEENFIFSIEHE